MGPAPVRADRGVRGLTGPRARILEFLQDRDRWVTVSETAAWADLHENTARKHLEGLVQRSLASRRPGPAHGRGRPGWQYHSDHENREPDRRLQKYVELVSALAGHITATSDDARLESLDIGHRWAHRLGPVAAEGPAVSAGEQITSLMTDLGFDPEPAGADAVRLRRCPFLDNALSNPEVVCGIHLGLIQAVVSSSSNPNGNVVLEPFHSGGGCLLHVPTAPSSPGPAT